MSADTIGQNALPGVARRRDTEATSPGAVPAHARGPCAWTRSGSDCAVDSMVNHRRVLKVQARLLVGVIEGEAPPTAVSKRAEGFERLVTK